MFVFMTIIDHCMRFRASKHGGPKKRVCNVCSHHFASSYALKQHMVYHAAPQFQCSVCGRKFKKRATLTDHLASHAGVKEHQCPCGKAYTYSQGLSNHKKTCAVVKSDVKVDVKTE